MTTAAHCRDAMAALLAEELPRRIALLRRAWGLNEETLPTAYVHSGEPAENALTSVAGTWVNVATPRDLAPMRRVDIDRAGAPVWETRYNASVECWVLGKDWPNAQTGRDHLVGVVRDVLMEYPTLTTGDEDTPYALHPDTLTTQRGSMMRSPARGSGRVWAPAVISCDMRAESSLSVGSSAPEPVRVDGVTYDIEKVRTSQPMPRRSNDPPVVYPTNL